MIDRRTRILLAELTQTPTHALHERLLRDIVATQLDELVHGVELQVGRVRNERNIAGNNVVADRVARSLEHSVHRVDVPAFIGRVTFHHDEHVRRAVGLELGLARAQEFHELVDHLDDVVPIDERKRQLHRASLDRHVRVFETLDDGRAMSLNGRHVGVHDLEERVECHVANVLVRVEQESTQNVDS